MKISKKKILGALAGATAITTLIMGSFAFFTDRATETVSGKTENLRIALSDFTVAFEEADVVSPGAIIPMSYAISNTGSLSADEREKLSLSVWAEDGSPIKLSAAPSEFEIYSSSDVEFVDGKGYVAKAGASPIGTRTTDGFTSENADGNVIIYQLEQSALNGTNETITDETPTGFNRDFVILFSGTAGNDFQNAQLKINVIVEAKQHTYTEAYDNDWSELQTASIIIDTGAQTAVPAAISE